MEVTGEGLDHLLGLVLAQQAVIDEHARELIADGLVYEQRGDRRVHAPRKRAQDALRTDRGADARDLLLDDGGRRPRGRHARDLVQEVLQDVLPVRRVRDLWVELHAVQPPLAILEGGNRRRGRARGHLGPRRRRGDRVAMAHPDRLVGRQVVEELRVAGLELGLAELGGACSLDGSAEVARHELHAVADAERRDPELEDLGVEVGCTICVDRRRPSGEDQCGRVARGDLCRRQPMPDQLRIDPRLADAPRDELAVLAPEVDHQHRALLRCDFGRRERDDLRHQRL
jgi:hypothetical protein